MRRRSVAAGRGDLCGVFVSLAREVSLGGAREGGGGLGRGLVAAWCRGGGRGSLGGAGEGLGASGMVPGGEGAGKGLGGGG